ncbi:MAG: FeoA family protein [Desulfuromonas sp.]|nr:FeoA family protein [Desulfuromonas sp.]
MCPLSQCKCGEVVYIRGFSGCPHTRKHLQDMGLIPGEEIRIISCGRGPMVISVKGSNLALGRGMANNIMVACKRCCPLASTP